MSTDAGVHEADVLVIALGADYDVDATPGLAEGGDEFYSLAGTERLAPRVAGFSQGHAVVGVCGAPFKCPPAPSECALLLHDELTRRGVRDACRISAATAAAGRAIGVLTLVCLVVLPQGSGFGRTATGLLLCAIGAVPLRQRWRFCGGPRFSATFSRC